MTSKRTSMIVAVAVCIVCSIAIAFTIAARWKIHSMARGPHGVPFGALPDMGQSHIPSHVTLVPLDKEIVSTGGSAVIALAAGHRTGGGMILNPLAAARPLCIIENGNASGPSSCIAPGGMYNLRPSNNEVLVISEDSYHLFNGYGMRCVP